MNLVIQLFLVLFVFTPSVTDTGDKVELNIEKGEYWWGGLSSKGHETPYNATTVVTYNLWGDNQGNQAQPLLLSSKGRYIWCEEPIEYSFNKGKLTVTSKSGKIQSGKRETT